MIYYKLNNNYLKADQLSLEDILTNDFLITLVKEDIEREIPNLHLSSFNGYQDMVNSYSKFLLSNDGILDSEFRDNRLSMLYDRVLNACEKHSYDKSEVMVYLQDKLTKMGIF